MDGGVGVGGLRAAAQNHGIAALQAQRPGVGGDVGAALVDDADDPQGHPHALYPQAVWAFPLGDNVANGIIEIGDALHTPCGRLYALFIKRESV